MLVGDRVVPFARPLQGLGFFTSKDGDIFEKFNVTLVQAIIRNGEVEILLLGFGSTGTGVLL